MLTLLIMPQFRGKTSDTIQALIWCLAIDTVIVLTSIHL